MNTEPKRMNIFKAFYTSCQIALQKDITTRDKNNHSFLGEYFRYSLGFTRYEEVMKSFMKVQVPSLEGALHRNIRQCD